jgi:hypothetical protein
MPNRLEDWVLTCGHTRAIATNVPLEKGDTARCYECPAKIYPTGMRLAPMKKLEKRAT